VDIRVPLSLSATITKFPIETCMKTDLEMTSLSLLLSAFVSLELCLFGGCIEVS
jgi:hypothetical protein